jgi:antitoxin component YwqK of YwqJK toxin-antitoxin module
MKVHPKILSRFLLVGMVFFGLSACNTSEQTGTTLNQVDSNNLKQGPWEIYRDSVLVARGSYVDDKPDGLWTFWYTNGETKEEGHYRRGVRTGMWVEWFRDGDILWKGEYRKGVRQIEWNGAKAEVTVTGESPHTRILAPDSLYQLKISLQNIPVSNVFVEVSGGRITPDEENPGLYNLITPDDTVMTLAIGYIPDLAFRDFRNLVTEVEFELRKVNEHAGSDY